MLLITVNNKTYLNKMKGKVVTTTPPITTTTLLKKKSSLMYDFFSLYGDEHKKLTEQV